VAKHIIIRQRGRHCRLCGANFQPSELVRAQAFIIDWGVKYLDHYQFIPRPCKGDLREKMDSQLVDFIASKNNFALLNFKNRLRNSGAVTAWTTMLEGTPELAHVAVALLSICASEAPVERSFSIQDLVHSKVRNRSGDDLVEAQMFIQINSRLLQSAVLPTITPKSSSYVEMLPTDPDDLPAPIELQYLVVVPAIVLPVGAEVLEALQAAAADSEAVPRA
jgi:hypothetical protein